MLILHSYTNTRLDDQRETKKWVRELTRSYRVISRKCVYNDDYWKFLLQYWNHPDILINVEQDVVGNIQNIRELRNCPNLACCYPYILGNNPLHRDKLCLFVFRGGDLIGTKDFLDYNQKPEWSTGSGLGLVKLSPQLRQTIDIGMYPADVYDWWFLDSWLSEQMARNGIGWHVHWPMVKHNHEWSPDRPAREVQHGR